MVFKRLVGSVALVLSGLTGLGCGCEPQPLDVAEKDPGQMVGYALMRVSAKNLAELQAGSTDAYKRRIADQAALDSLHERLLARMSAPRPSGAQVDADGPTMTDAVYLGNNPVGRDQFEATYTMTIFVRNPQDQARTDLATVLVKCRFKASQANAVKTCRVDDIR